MWSPRLLAFNPVANVYDRLKKIMLIGKSGIFHSLKNLLMIVWNEVVVTVGCRETGSTKGE